MGERRHARPRFSVESVGRVRAGRPGGAARLASGAPPPARPGKRCARRELERRRRRMIARGLSAAGLVVLIVGCQSAGPHERATAAATERWSLTRAAVKAKLAADEFQAGRFEEAESAVTEARDLDPENTEYQILQARVLLAAGKEAQAERILTALPNDSTLSPEALYLFGILAQQRLRWHDALQYYEAALDARPDDTAYLTAVVQALLQLDRPEQALATLRRAEPLVGWTPAYFAALAECHEHMEHWAAAAAAWRRAVSGGNDAESVERLALAQFRAGQWEAAIESFAELRALRGSLSTHAEIANAESLLEVERFDDAQKALARVLRMKPRSAAALRLLARVYWATDRPNQAVEAIEKAAYAAPNDPRTIEMAAAMAYAGGQTRLAEEMARRAKALAPNGASEIADRILALAKGGDRQP
ncbi:MAG: hypothetical protein D6744_07835 [Planctomycetota bacterium]|nr:MAG: hypothetical protein D6744_07835 [Planctomycetota bacterium]